MADNATEETPTTISSLCSSHWIAKPVALKSNNAELRQATGSMGINPSSFETMHDPFRLPSKNSWVWPPKMAEPARTSCNVRERIDLSISSQKSNFGNSLLSNLPLWRSGKQADTTAPSVDRDDLLQTTFDVRQTHPTRVLSEKRSAFREVAKRSYSKRLRSEKDMNKVCETKPNEELQKMLPKVMKKTETLDNRKEAPLASFCDPIQNMSTVSQNNRVCVYHNITGEPQESFGSSSLHALKSQPHMNFVNTFFVENEHAKAAFSTQFGPLRYFSPVERASNLTYPWQQPLVPANVLPLSSSVSGPHLDNWCAKCNASFRMTSDLVYHMRTQHKRSVDCPDGGANASVPASPDGSDGKRADEIKLKCDRCGEMFRERHHLTRHMTSHNDTDRM